MRDLVAAADLLVGAACPGCGAPALAVCGRCAPTMRPAPEWVTGAARLRHVDVVAGGENGGALRRVVVDWKERGRFPLTGLLSAHLAVAVAELVDHRDRVVLVPVPTAWAARRRRGDDLVLSLARAAADRLEAVGCAAFVRPVLRRTRRTVDQARLGAEARARNLHGAFRLVRDPDLAPTGHAPAPIVVVDDVVTTGATLAEAVRALGMRGWPVAGAAVVAATPAPR